MKKKIYRIIWSYGVIWSVYFNRETYYRNNICVEALRMLTKRRISRITFLLSSEFWFDP